MLASHVPVDPLSQTASLQRFLPEPSVVSHGEVRRMLPLWALHMMNLTHQGIQFPQGTCDTEGSWLGSSSVNSHVSLRQSTCFQGKREQALVLILSMIITTSQHKNCKPGRGACSQMMTMMMMMMIMMEQQ